MFASIGFIRVTFLPERKEGRRGRLGYETLKFHCREEEGEKKFYTALVFDDELISLSLFLSAYTNERRRRSARFCVDFKMLLSFFERRRF